MNKEFNKKLIAKGKHVVLKKLEVEGTPIIKGIIIPEKEYKGYNATKAVIQSMGKDTNGYGLSVGDTVLYDHYSAYYDVHPIIVVDIQNIIGKIKSKEN